MGRRSIQGGSGEEFHRLANMGTDANPFTHRHPDLLERVTRRMHVLSDPTRLRLLLALEQHEACVQQLADELGLVHRNVSHGLNLLYREGLLSRRREGTLAVYSLADYSACRLVAQATASVTAQIEELGDLIPSRH